MIFLNTTHCLCIYKDQTQQSKVKKLTSKQIEDYVNAIGSKYPSRQLEASYSTTRELPCSKLILQWMEGCNLCEHIFVFAPDGVITMCTLNCPVGLGMTARLNKSMVFIRRCKTSTISLQCQHCGGLSSSSVENKAISY